ncbi:sulfurtransferase TusA family protein [Lacrimispora sp. 210928-DFI.3.58]|uniref:sulfurtransferase TusA family protein n=1 Tax=Lacrimispora sp. 210928-DFI.3.58 TaxID=2883214 RepID=UPI0015B64137|nr:sulfurtransferase TusA family protein [Lacrimispora sp. 210928-DFI.3.58]MCB7317310.1 sulfurtransferase TusA family protein [Lacrimispora sp. 210928-DFI.3.58]
MGEIDVRGLSCPEPVLIVMDEMDRDPKAKLVVLSDAAHTRDNLVKLAHEYGRTATVSMRGRDFEITIA